MEEFNYDLILTIFAATTVFLLLATFAIAFTVIYKKKQQDNLNEKDLLEKKFNEQLLQSQLEIKEQTLKDIGYELHDNLGQISSLIKINLNTIKLDNSFQAQQKIDESKSLLKQLIGDLKNISTNLNSDRIIHQGICEGIKGEVEKVNKLGKLSAKISFPENQPVFDDNTTVIIYRMSQEILNNALKHSHAKHIDVTIEVFDKKCIFVFADDGIGFDHSKEIMSGGSGLLNLENRAKLINAKIEFKSTPNIGTTIIMEIPCN